MAGTTLSGSTDKTVPLFMIGAMVLFGVGGAVIIVARPASSPRRDTILFFLAGAASAAVAGGAADSPLATFIAVLNALLALIMCVLSTLLTAEQSLDNPRSRF